MNLLESIAADEAKLKAQGITLAEDENDINPNEGESTHGEENGNDARENTNQTGEGDVRARGRIGARRAARLARGSSQGEGDASQENGGASRGSRGSPSGSGEGASEDAQASSGDARSSQSSDGLEDDAETKTPAQQARERREVRELKARIKELETSKAAAPAAPAAPQPEVKATPTATGKDQTFEEKVASLGEAPDSQKDLAGHLVYEAQVNRLWREEQTRRVNVQQEETRRANLWSQADREIDDIQASYNKVNPDFEPAITHAKSEYKKALKIIAPQATAADLDQAVKVKIRQLALQCNRDGTNLGEVLYDMAIEQFNYDGNDNPLPSRNQGNGQGNRPRPPANLRVIANNKRRAASSLDGGGQGAKAFKSDAEYSRMSLEELMSLDEDETKYLESRGF